MNEMFDTSITFRVQFFAVIGSLILFLMIINLIRRENLKEGYSIFWIFISAVMLIFSLFSSLLFKFSGLIGIYYAPTALLLILLLGILLILIQYSVVISQHDKKIKDLAQENGLLKQRLEKLSVKKGK
jgi:hypothetical protein